MMEATFWSGYVLDNFMFSHININSYPGFIGVCIITVAIALAFEGSRTVRDWLYVEFLKKRSCPQASGDTPIALRNVKPLAEKNGKAEKSVNGEVSKESNGKNGAAADSSSTVVNASAAAPVAVIATGTIRSVGKSCDKPNFCVGLLELSCSTLLHMCQVILGYILMLMVMTFNVWIFVAVLIGTSTGFFLFDSFNKRIHAIKINTETAK